MNITLVAPSVSLLLLALNVGSSSTAYAQANSQARPQPAPASRPSRSFQVGGYAVVGKFTFKSSESFDAILGITSAPVVGGGARVGLPFGGLFVDAGAWRLRRDGERVFVWNNTVYPLNIPVEVTMTTVALSAGWQFHLRRVPKLLPYVAGGFTSMNYVETSDFSTPAEDVSDTFGGYHLCGGVEYRILGWLGAAAEATWTTVPDALGGGGVSKAFSEDNLGGTSVRFKITVGR
jgi:hypothetical protein